jgi:hypothetical protein
VFQVHVSVIIQHLDFYASDRSTSLAFYL